MKEGVPSPPWSLEFSSFVGLSERPALDADHQSNVPGLYIVGDLADAPVIKLAMQQGQRVGKRLAHELSAASSEPGLVDVLIVGAGPAGVSAALALKDTGLRILVLEQREPFATISDFPSHKELFSEPRHLPPPEELWFEDATREELVARWLEAVAERNLPIRYPETVVSIRREQGVFVVNSRPSAAAPRSALPAPSPPSTPALHSFRARRVVLAMGKRGQPNRLHIPGEDRPHVLPRLIDASAHKGSDVVVIGGGDSAVEAANALATAGAQVQLVVRSREVIRAQKKNRERLADSMASGRVSLSPQSRPIRITENSVELESVETGIRRTVPADAVLPLIGARPPVSLLRSIGVRLESEWGLGRWAWLSAFLGLTWMFYVLKRKLDFFPFQADDMLGFVPGLLQSDLGFRTVDAGFWGTVVYTLMVVGFGLRAMRHRRSPAQRRRYWSLMGFQVVFLFGVPELLAPLIIDRPWKVYAATVPWPLSIWSLVDAPGHVPGASADEGFWTSLGWLAVGALTSFVLIPLYVRRHGQSFCSYLCGCGGLAETLGESWRHLAPRGRDAKRAEWFGRAILLAAIPVTGLILNDAWGFVATDALYSTKAFAAHWYELVVDFGLASILGVAMYPYLGNRVWCRFFCPLRAWMEILARRFSLVSIRSSDRCISCGECTRYCQMGIDVQQFAQREVRLDNSNSACIQCGVCIEVCPMDVLTLDRNRTVGLRLEGSALQPPVAAWEQSGRG